MFLIDFIIFTCKWFKGITLVTIGSCSHLHSAVVFTAKYHPLQVSEWHKKLEEVRLLEMRQSRELGAQREKIKYLRNIVAEQERTISALEEELVQQNNVSIAFKHVSSLFFFYSI